MFAAPFLIITKLMATLKQGVDSVIRTARGGGVPSDDEKISERYVRYLFNKHRSPAIVQFAFQDNPISPTIDLAWVQDWGCQKLEEVDLSECSGIPWGCTVKRTINELPDYIDIPNSDRRLFYVGDISGRNNYDEAKPSQLGIANSLTFSGVINKYYIKNSRIYVMTSNVGLCWIGVQAVFSDPMSVCKGSTQTAPCCFNWLVDEYPVSSDMMRHIEREILTEEFQLILQTPSDETNNSVSIPVNGGAR